jgi:hypothetical protein
MEWEWWCLLSSDRHWDNPKSDLKLQRKHLDQVRGRGAAILDLGDFLDLMGGKFDKRSHKDGVRKEHVRDDYFDAVIEDAADWFAPYANHFIAIAQGNHESAMVSRHEFNPTERLISQLNANTGSRIYNGGFSGWVVFAFNAVRPNSRARITTVVANFHHGFGGGGAVTHDAIAHQRRSVYLPDADLVLSGHTHDLWTKDIARLRLGQNGVVYHDVQVHVKCGTYKEEYRDGFGGWAVEKGFPPKPIGAWWVRFYWDPSKERVLFEMIKAQ